MKKKFSGETMLFSFFFAVWRNKKSDLFIDLE